MNWKHWNWVKQLVLPTAVAALRACWLWPWLLLVAGGLSAFEGNVLLSVPWIIGLNLAGMAVAQWVLRTLPADRQIPGPERSRKSTQSLFKWRGVTRERLWVALAGLGMVFLALWWHFYRPQHHVWELSWIVALGLDLTHWPEAGVPAPLITLLVSAYLWLRGVLDSRRPLFYEDVWGAFVRGFVALVLLVLVTAAFGAALPADLGVAVLAFFAAGMSALALASLEMARRTGRGRHGVRADVQVRLNLYWLLSVASVVGVLLGFGLLLSVLIAPETVARALGWTTVLLDVLGLILFYIIYAISYVVFLVLEPLFFLLQSLIDAETLPEPPEMGELQEEVEAIGQEDGLSIPSALRETLRWTGLVLLILVIAAVFALALRRLWVDDEEEIEEVRELILSRDLLQRQLSRLLGSWLQRLRGGSGRFDPFLPLTDEVDARRAVREVYQALLAAGAQRGSPRLPGQTPWEYQLALALGLPQAREGLRTITEGYVQARYGAEAPAAEEVERVRRAWQDVQSLLDGRSGAR